MNTLLFLTAGDSADATVSLSVHPSRKQFGHQPGSHQPDMGIHRTIKIKRPLEKRNGLGAQ